MHICVLQYASIHVGEVLGLTQLPLRSRSGYMLILTLKEPNEIGTDNTFIFINFYLSKKKRLDVSCESSASHEMKMACFM